MTINKKISLALGIAIIVVSAGTAVYQNVNSGSYSTSVAPTGVVNNTQSPTTSNTAVTTTAQAKPASSSKTQSTSNLPSSYTLANIAVHNNGSSCWSAINGGVYDLTSWINQHPGGSQAILSICGKDGSAAFNDQHGGQRRPANELAGFKIGVLASS